MERRINHIHFQITRNCNLRCAFCGQWGKKGFFSDISGEEMTFSDWENIVNQLESYRKKEGISPLVTVWGGEPLVSPFFDKIMLLLKRKGFETEVITNGVLICNHLEVLTNCADKIYVSVDGTKEIHDAIRGNGVYDKVMDNLKKLRHKNVTVMSVITKKLTENLPIFLKELNELNICELFLQDMIGLSSSEVIEYKNTMKDFFGINADFIDSWENNEKINFSDELKKALAKIDQNALNYKVIHKKHSYDKTMICKSPFTHPHIAWNGEVIYCTDFYDFSAGNVKREGLENIFLNEKSEIFRQIIENGKCTSCNHCSWRGSISNLV